jgi:serine/threonine protein kinase
MENFINHKSSENNSNCILQNNTTLIRHSVFDWKSDAIDNFELLELVGKGTFGAVYKAKLKSDKLINNEFQINKEKLVINSNNNINNADKIKEKHNNKIIDFYALKEILTDKEKEGFPITALREIMLLKRIKHPNVIQLQDVVMNRTNNKVYLVFEYMEHDLAGLLDRKYTFSLEQVKYIFFSLLQGLQYLHSQNILHRDIKSSNVLINNEGDIKLADFGLAKMCNFKYLMTNRVVTLWYRAPELLLGENQYDYSIDIWAMG